LKLSALRKGDTVSVVAPAGPLERDRIGSGLKVLEAMGHPVRRGASLMARHGFLAGDDRQRAADLNRAIRTKDPAIFFARGGWGTARLLDRLDLHQLKRRPRVLLGFSDLTTLFMALQRPGHGYPVRYGPSVSELGEPHAYHRGSLESALYLTGNPMEYRLGASGILRSGRGEGLLIGGCLTLLVGLLGTPYDISWDGALLFWEEVNEPPYAIDRMLTQLRLAGKLKNLAGMVVGKLVGCKPRGMTRGLPLREIILDATAGTRYPIVTGIPAGHYRPKKTILLGVPGRIDSGSRLFTMSG
jgi:muramoyltetrapeptide carboxypeptidase